MMVLSEIGVNIGPLLAGAGIVGVAIGFGSQKLVRDLITGIFLLLENAMQVGDSVTVSGLSGTVENLSVRTIRLRAADGSVHIIPFSSVTTVTNVNRGLGNASVEVSVAAQEDTDRVCEVLKEIVAGMREDADFSARMLSDLQLWGVDKLDGASVTIAGQVVCTDSGRWSVQREFNRRMKRRFEELGIQLYNPVRAHGRECGRSRTSRRGSHEPARRHARGRGIRLRARRGDARAVRPRWRTGRRSRRAGTISASTPTWPMADAIGSAGMPRSARAPASRSTASRTSRTTRAATTIR